jgi:hypothetical protein
MVSAERAKTTWLTGAAGLLILVVALVMMAFTAPARPHPWPHRSAVSHSVPGDRLASWTGPVPAAFLILPDGPRRTRTERGPTLTWSPARAGGPEAAAAGTAGS